MRLVNHAPEAFSAAEAAAMLDWLLAAGCDVPVADHPRGWLAAPRAVDTSTAVPMAEQAPVMPVAAPGAPPPPPPPPASTLDELHEAVAALEHPLRRASIVPQLISGAAESGIWILCDRPEPDGPVAELLARMLGAIGLDWQRAALVHRLPWPTPGNIDPRPEHFRAFDPLLAQLMRLAPPRLILAMGAQSAAIAGVEASRASSRGRWFVHGEAALLPTFHPRRVLGHAENRKLAWADLQRFKERLD
jgi:DNA polymerase